MAALLPESPLLGAHLGSTFYFAHRDLVPCGEGPGLPLHYQPRHCPLSCPHRRLLHVRSDPGPPSLRKPPPSASSNFSFPNAWHSLLSSPATPQIRWLFPAGCPRPCLHLQGRGLPSPLAFGARPVTHVLVDSRRWTVGSVLVAVHQRFAHSRQPVEHDYRRPDLLQAEHVPEAAPQLQAKGRGCLASPGPAWLWAQPPGVSLWYLWDPLQQRATARTLSSLVSLGGYIH